jgi:hypothetical protein
MVKVQVLTWVKVTLFNLREIRVVSPVFWSQFVQLFVPCWATGKWVAMNCQSALDLPKPSSAGIHSEVDQVLHPRFVGKTGK